MLKDVCPDLRIPLGVNVIDTNHVFLIFNYHIVVSLSSVGEVNRKKEKSIDRFLHSDCISYFLFFLSLVFMTSVRLSS